MAEQEGVEAAALTGGDANAVCTVFCTECGKPMQSDWKFCRVCGNKSPSVPDLLAPAKIVSEPSNRSDMAVLIGDRLVYDFEKHHCCPCSNDGLLGLHEKVKDQLPAELRSKGISEKEWRDWMISLDDIQQTLSPSVCCVLTTLCFPGGIVQCCLCAMCCPLSMNHCLSCLPCCFGDWHGALNKWQSTVNQRLKDNGCSVKLMTYKPYGSAPDSALKAARIVGKDSNYEMGFMAIALTDRESAILEAEGWDHGVNDNCLTGVGRAM